MKPWSFDSPIMEKLGFVGDIIILNIIFLVSCLPLVTIGAAIASLYSVTMKMARGESAPVFQTYCSAFKQNFKDGSISGIVLFIFLALIWVDFHLIAQLSNGPKTILGIVLGLLLGLFFLVTAYIFPLIAKMKNNIKENFKNALFMSISHFPLTLLLVGLNLGMIILMMFSPRMFTIMLLIFVFFGFAFFSFVKAKIYSKIFKKLGY
jgi:uncharacterized membrane protein YesL